MTTLAQSAKSFLDAGGNPNYSTLISPSVEYELYNPSPREIEFGVFGMVFRIPACNQYWRGLNPATGQTMVYEREGVLPIFSQHGRGFTAADIVRHVLGHDGRRGRVLGVRGVRMLFGDNEEVNQKVRAEAQGAWLNREMAVVEQVIARWEHDIAQADAQKVARPQMPLQVREAYESRRAWTESPTRQFSCSICNWPQESEEAVWIHVLSMHKDKADEVAQAKAALKVTGRLGVVEERSVQESKPVPNLDLKVKDDPNERELVSDAGLVEHGVNAARQIAAAKAANKR